MKILTSLSTLLALATLALGQGGVYYSNNVARAEAIGVASQLRVGMWEEHASQQLATNGLKYAIRVGAQAGWGSFYGLSDGTSLHLDYRAREVGRGGWWGGNGVLKKASIQSNAINIVFITLTNAP